MYSAKIKSLYEEYGELIEFCRLNGQVSFELYINDTYKKALLLSAASYFETVITKTIHDFVNGKTKYNVEIVSFVDNKAMKRQYHTFLIGTEVMLTSFLDYLVTHLSEELEKRFRQKNLMRPKLLF